MKSDLSIFFRPLVVCSLLAIFVLALPACDRSNADAKPASGAQASQARPAMPVSVKAVQPANLPVMIDAVGQAEGSSSVEVRSRVTGIIQKTLFQDGESIAAGAPMYEIEQAPFEIALNQANANLAQERARLVQANQQRDRLQKLKSRNIVSRSDYDAAIANLRSSQAAYRVAESKVAEAELNLSYTRIHAPVAGMTGKSQRSVGSLVSAAMTMPLTTIVTTDPIWASFALNDQDLRRIGSPDKAVVTLLDSAGNELLGNGRLNFAGSTVDARTGTIPMRATFANPSLSVLPGQFVQVRVKTGDRSAYLVPQASVSQNATGAIVWVIDGQGKAQPRPVKTAEWQGQDWVIESGLNPGDQVITNNLIKLRPGAPVKPMAPPKQSGGKPVSGKPAG